MENLNFKVSGINCQACTKLIKMDLEELPGVHQVEVNLDGSVTILSKDPIEINEIKKALKETEYKVIEGKKE